MASTASPALNEDEKRQLNQIMGNAYLHLFAFVEEFIVPTVTEAWVDAPYGDEVRQRSLVRFSEEELKHQALFRRSIALFNEQFGMTPPLIPGREEVAAVVRSKSKLGVLLLIDVIEWFVQVHYTEHVLDKTELDGLFRDLLKHHWLDEAQHAKIDTMLIAETVEGMPMAEREAAIDEVIELGGAVDGLLQQQIAMNIDALETVTGRTFNQTERDEITAADAEGVALHVPRLRSRAPERSQAGRGDHGGGAGEDPGCRGGAIRLTLEHSTHPRSPRGTVVQRFREGFTLSMQDCSPTTL